MKYTHSILVSLGLIIAIAVVLVFMLRINGGKSRRLMDLSNEQQKKDHAEKYANFFEVLKLVRNNLEASKIALQHLAPKNKSVVTVNSGIVQSTAVKDDLLISSNCVMESDTTKEVVVEKIGAVDGATDPHILEQKIAKTTEYMHGLNIALKRLLEAKERVRAEAQSLPMDNVKGLSSFRPYLPIFLGEEMYAVGMATVQEVLYATKLFVDPGMPEKIRSAINLDGAVVPVIDLSNHLGGKTTKVGRNTLIVILLLRIDGGLQRVGIKADGVGNVMTVDQANVVPSRPKADGIRSDFEQGEYITEDYSIKLLDFNQRFTSKSILRLQSRCDGLSSSTPKNVM